MDNASIHKSRAVKVRLEKSFEAAYCLPPYSHQFAPVKHFFACFKRGMIGLCRNNPTNLNTDHEMETVKKALLEIEQDKIVNMWIHCLGELRKFL